MKKVLKALLVGFVLVCSTFLFFGKTVLANSLYDQSIATDNLTLGWYNPAFFYLSNIPQNLSLTKISLKVQELTNKTLCPNADFQVEVAIHSVGGNHVYGQWMSIPSNGNLTLDLSSSPFTGNDFINTYISFGSYRQNGNWGGCTINDFGMKVYGSNSVSSNYESHLFGYSDYNFTAYTSLTFGQDSINTPVLIVPGVLGTDMEKDNQKLWLDLGHNFTDIGDQFMDPLQFDSSSLPIDKSLVVGSVITKQTVNLGVGRITVFDYIAGLIQEFQNQGYTEGKDLFTFPYDWRYGVTGSFGGKTNVDLLKDKIQEIVNQTGSGKVDVIAHSTGGLLVKKYVMDNSASHYIGKAVFVGVPSTGAPKAIKVLLEGDSFSIPWLADGEMKKISQNLPVIYDLSPSQKYYSTKGSYLKVINEGVFGSSGQDLDFNEANNFLVTDHNANSQALVNAHNLHVPQFDNFDLRAAGVDLYSVAGCKTGTIGKVIERRVTNILGSVNVTFNKPEEVPGDGTVPLESATNLPIDQNHIYYSLDADHGKMPSQDGIREQIVNIIAGSSLAVGNNIIQEISRCKLKGKAFSVYSPVDINIIDQYGNISGLVNGGIQNDIPNADFQIMGEHKFVYLPTDEGQVYKINLKGTSNGTFTFKDETINDNQVTQTQVFSNLPVTTSLVGQVNLASTTTLSLQATPTSTPVIVSPTSILNTNQSQDVISPVSTSTLIGPIGQPGFYRGEVGIKLSATDPVIPGHESQTSGLLKTQYSLDNQAYKACPVPVTKEGRIVIPECRMEVNAEGQHSIKIFSTDKAGNNEQEQTVSFAIDRTAPEAVIQFNPNTKDLDFIGNDNLSTSSAVSILDQDDAISLTDQAGNATVIKLKEKQRKNKMKAEIASLFYNGKYADISKVSFKFSWEYDKSGQLKSLGQRIQSKKDFILEAVYKDGNTKLEGKDQNGKIKKTLNGLALVKITTNKGDVDWSY